MFFKTQPEKVIIAIQKLQIKKVENLLLDKFKYLDLPKSVFIVKLSIVFQLFKEGGDTFLNTEEGRCTFSFCKSNSVFTKCDGQISSKGICFIGNKTQRHIYLVFDLCGGLFQEPNHIIDIRECSNFSVKNKAIKLSELLVISP